MFLVTVKVKDNYPYIVNNRDIEDNDLGSVVEGNNSIRFILEDEDNWKEISNGLHELKIRLKLAPTLDKELRELKDNNKIKMVALHWVHLATICQVYKVTTTSEGLKEEVQRKLYASALDSIQTAIHDFNINSMMKGA